MKTIAVKCFLIQEQKYFETSEEKWDNSKNH